MLINRSCLVAPRTFQIQYILWGSGLDRCWQCNCYAYHNMICMFMFMYTSIHSTMHSFVCMLTWLYANTYILPKLITAGLHMLTKCQSLTFFIIHYATKKLNSEFVWHPTVYTFKYACSDPLIMHSHPQCSCSYMHAYTSTNIYM